MAGMCGVLCETETAAAAPTGLHCEKTSRAARRRRMEIRRFKFGAGVDIEPHVAQKKPRTHLAASAIAGDDSSLLDSNDDAGVIPVVSPQPKLAISGECPAYGMMSVCGRRRDMEDAVAIVPDLHRHVGHCPATYHLFAVFDGHGCSHVAVSCKQRMHEIVASELVRSDRRSSKTSLDWKNVMEKSFSQMDGEAAAWRGGPQIPACRCDFHSPKCGHVGSTAVVAIVSGEHVVVANCGDSRAVLCRNGAPLPLSSDHKPDRPDELRRIQDGGGRVIFWDSARVLGVLAMSRAIGDNYLKPFVIAEPEVTVMKREGGDQFLIIASDGLWDVVTNEMACDIVRICLRCSEPPEPHSDLVSKSSDKACTDAAMLLTKLALARQSADNISVVVVDLRRRL